MALSQGVSWGNYEAPVDWKLPWKFRTGEMVVRRHTGRTYSQPLPFCRRLHHKSRYSGHSFSMSSIVQTCSRTINRQVKFNCSKICTLTCLQALKDSSCRWVSQSHIQDNAIKSSSNSGSYRATPPPSIP